MKRTHSLCSLAALALITVVSSTAAVRVHAAPVVLDRLVASVNNSIILQSDIRRFRDTLKLRAQLDPLFSGTALAAKGAQASDAEITEFLIDERLIAQQFSVADTDVEQEINSIQANNHIDRATLKKALSEQGFSFDQYFELIRTSASKRNLIDRDIRTKVTVSDDDVKNYFYNKYARSSAAPMSYHLQIISVSTGNYKNPAAAKEVAVRALNDIRNGEAFEDVAKRMSDHATGSSGGDLGTVTDDQMSPAIRERVKNLRIGEVSDVFGGPQVSAFYIVKLVGVKSADNERLERMKEEIRSQLSASEYQHQIQLWLDRQRQTAFIHRAGEPTTAGLPTAPLQ